MQRLRRRQPYLVTHHLRHTLLLQGKRAAFVPTFRTLSQRLQHGLIPMTQGAFDRSLQASGASSKLQPLSAPQTCTRCCVAGGIQPARCGGSTIAVRRAHMQQTAFDAQQLPAYMLMPAVFARAQPILPACRVAAAKGDQPGARRPFAAVSVEGMKVCIHIGH